MSSTKGTTYKKRLATSGIQGQLYETKLISLVLFKLLHDDRFEEFYLASNMDEIGGYDDLCFKAKIKGLPKPILVFLQAKHKDDDNTYLKFDTVKSVYDSYTKVIQKFYLNNKNKVKDKLFTGKFEDHECVFILYTNGSYHCDSDRKFDSDYADALNDLLATGKVGTQLNSTNKLIEEVSESITKEEIAILAERFTKFLNDKSNQSMNIMLDEYILRYHVILAKTVVNISEIHSDELKPDSKWRILTFRTDFFDTIDTHADLLKKSLFKQIIQNQVNAKKSSKSVEELNSQFRTFLNNPCALTLSPLIGAHISYKNGKLEFISQTLQNYIQELEQIKLPQSVVDEAEAITAKNILQSLELKVPVTFGNLDLNISNRRIDHLTKNIINICNKSKDKDSYKVITLDETIEKGLLGLNGGLAGAVGNLLVYDQNTKMLRFSENSKSLQNNARIILQKLNSSINNLDEYRFDVKPSLLFPKSSFAEFDYSDTANEILNRVVIYAKQRNHNGVEEILKKLIEKHYSTKNPHIIQVKTDSVFQNYHNEVQTWWLSTKNAYYLTKTSKLYQHAINNIIIEPLMTSIKNTFHMSKMKNIEYTEESLESLQAHSVEASITIIRSDFTTLTAIKVIQYLRNKGIENYSVLDTECMFNLSTEDFCALKAELNKTQKVLIIICAKNNTPYHEKCLKEISEVVKDKQKVLIISAVYLKTTQQLFSLHEKESCENIITIKHSLVDLTFETRKHIMKKSKIIFQGDETTLDLLVDDMPAEFIEGAVLNKIFLNDPIKIGEPLNNPNYEKVKNLYVDRDVEYIKCQPLFGSVKCGCSLSVIDYINQNSRCICCIFPKMMLKKTYFLKNVPGDSENNILLKYTSRNYLKELEKFLPLDDTSTSGTQNNDKNAQNNNDASNNSQQGESSSNNVNINVQKQSTTDEESKKEQDNFSNDATSSKEEITDDDYFIENFIDDFFNFNADDMKEYKLENPIFFVNLRGYVQSAIVFPGEEVGNIFYHDFNFSCYLLPEYVLKGVEFIEFLLVDRTDAQYISNLFSIKRDQLENKIWCVGIKLLDRTGEFNRWQNNKQIFRDTLKMLHYVCHCVILNYICQNETVRITKTVGCPESGTNDVDYFIIYKNAKLLLSDDIQKNRRQGTSKHVKEECHHKVILDYYAHNPSNLIANIIAASNGIRNEVNVPLNNTQVDASNDNDKLEKHFLNILDSNGNFKPNFFIHLCSKNRYLPETFHDVKENVVLLTARPGMGKSTLLTHLSLKTKALDKRTWIIRINLLDHSEVFSKWEQDKTTVIDTLSTLKLISQVIIKDKNITINLKESGDKVYLEYCSGDEWIKFLLNIFLYFYNQRRLILLCDGFDEICPHYKNEVMKFLRAIKSYPQKNKTWVTSRQYDKIKPDLEIYSRSLHLYNIKLAYLTKTQQLEYLTKFWDANLKLQNLCKDNMKSLLHCVLNENNKHQIIYYFYSYIELKYPLQEALKSEFKTHIDRIKEAYLSPEGTSEDCVMSEVDEFLGTPLLLHLTADYFVNRLLNFKTFNNKQHFNMIALYNQFVETKLKSILFKDKCGVNIEMPFMKEQCELALKECIKLHKRLGAHVVFGTPLFKRDLKNLHEDVAKDLQVMSPFNLMDEDENKEFSAIMERIRSGSEKTGLITRVTDDNIPIFLHETFADYFATEYVCDVIKSSKFEYEQKRLIWFLLLATSRYYIANRTLMKKINITRSWLTEKIKIDNELRTIVLNIQSKPWGESDRYFKHVDFCRCPNKSCTKLLNIE